MAAYQACHFIGMPECSVHLTEAVVYMSLAPKSNALYMAYEHAKKDALNQLAEPVPLVIRNAPTRLMKELHYGEGYQYAHDTEDKLTDHAVPARLAAGKDLLPSPPSRGRRQSSRPGWSRLRTGSSGMGDSWAIACSGPGEDLCKDIVPAPTFWALRPKPRVTFVSRRKSPKACQGVPP